MAKRETNERAAIRVARNIAQDIHDQKLRPGSFLDPEHVMVEKLGVARATVREALRFLELQGALRIKAGPDGGPIVNVPHTEHLASAISLQLQFANAPFQSVIDASMSIYTVLAAEAARKVTEDMLEAALRYWKKTAPELLDEPITWLTTELLSKAASPPLKAV